ncbi:hypothetical protein SEA_GEAZY_63 [Gordonia phage GEazy]|nr:hypothetical protein SEA_GEAZY_63 [Gordonia phage GEazy]QDF16772.1 hypothetical protein SEA_HANNAHD_60 [Gordonia phage HannahD]
MTKMTTIRVQVGVSEAELRKWAEWHSDHHHNGVAEILFRAANDVAVQSTELEQCRTVLAQLRDLVVWTDEKRCGGEPCVRGTRVWVSTIADLLDDCTDEEIVDSFPVVQQWQVSILRLLGGAP